MTLYRVRRILIASFVTLGITGAASALGLSVVLFLAGILGGGALTAAYLAARSRIR